MPKNLPLPEDECSIRQAFTRQHNNNLKGKFTSSHALLLFILLIAGVLRFWNYIQIPFTYDEFSAFFRLQYDRFDDLIAYGVKPDGHPAGIQVFLYYWSRWFGSDPWIIKLPFTLFGLGAVGLTYAIGKRRYNQTVGLVCAAFLASLPYTVLYSQIARMYISGLFFALVMIYFWDRLVRQPEKSFAYHAIGFIFGAALCAYNHHFSLLFAAMVGVTGLFLIPRSYFWKYAACGLAIFLLYSPHLPIFFAQLELGGVEGWLAKPSPSFLLNYLTFVVGFNPLAYALSILLTLLSVTFWRGLRFDRKRFFMALTWFLIPLLIGYIYSVFVNAVLQYSVLIFSFPMLLFVLFGNMKEFSTKWNTALVLLILAVNAYGLIVIRDHYRIFYASPYFGFLNDLAEARDRFPYMPAYIQTNDRINHYFESRFGFTEPFEGVDVIANHRDLERFLADAANTNIQLFTGLPSGNDPNTLPLISKYYPYVLWQRNYAGGTTYLLSQAEGMPILTDVAKHSFEATHQNGKTWSTLLTENLTDSLAATGSVAYEIKPTTAYSVAYSAALRDILTHENNIVAIEVNVRALSILKGAELVGVIKGQGHVNHWQSIDLEMLRPYRDTAWFTAGLALKMSDISFDLQSDSLDVYIWNREKAHLIIDDFIISRIEGNELLYWINEPKAAIPR